MVAMTLTLFVMLILTQAFVTSLDIFDGLKGIGDMEGHLRTVATNLRQDLAQDHFEGKRRASDADFWNPRTKEGLLYIAQQSPSLSEGIDLNSIGSPVTFKPLSAPSYHTLAFTNRLRGNQREKVYATGNLTGSPLLDPALKTTYFGQSSDALFHDSDPPSRFHSNWAFISYVLVRTGSTLEIDNATSAVGTPLHSLYRVEQLLVPNTIEVNSAATVALRDVAQMANYSSVSCSVDPADNSKFLFNSPADMTNASRRTIPIAGGSTPPTGGTLLLTNVISFNIRVLPYLEATSSLQAFQASDFQDLPSGQNFDSNTPQLWGTQQYRIHALEITIRIWDYKTEQARQITIVQGL